MGRACNIHGWKKRNAYVVLTGKPEGNRPPGRHRRRRENNIKTYLREIQWGSMSWIDLAQEWDRWRTLVNRVMKLRFP
jgi:hypothetical protein